MKTKKKMKLPNKFLPVTVPLKSCVTNRNIKLEIPVDMEMDGNTIRFYIEHDQRILLIKYIRQYALEQKKNVGLKECLYFVKDNIQSWQKIFKTKRKYLRLS